MKAPPGFPENVDADDPMQIAIADLLLLGAETMILVAQAMMNGSRGSANLEKQQTQTVLMSRSLGFLTGNDREKAFRLYVQFALSILTSVWGDEARRPFVPGASTPENKSDSLRTWIKMIAPVIEEFGEHAPSISPASVIEALDALQAGETHSVFKPAANRSRSKTPHTHHETKYELWLIRKTLAELGLSPREIRKIADETVGVRWDVMRKWGAAAIKILPSATVDRITAVHQTMLSGGKPPEIVRRMTERVQILRARYRSSTKGELRL